MKPHWKLIWITLLLALASSRTTFAEGTGAPPTSNTADASATKILYTCGMHPWIIQDHPGNCPICGMKLEPIHKSPASVPSSSNSAASDASIKIDPATIQLMNIQTAQVVRGPLRRTIRTVGTLDYNETALTEVTTKFRGWIEKLDVDATGQLVHRGEPLFEVYSPELYSAEAEYLAALNATNDSSGQELREAAREKLSFFDIADSQIAALEHNRKPLKTLEITAPADGFVTEKNIVQGQMVEAGTRLYRLADLGIVWVYAQVYEQDLPYVQLGQEATVKLSSMPDREFRGRVTYVYPDVDEKTRTAKVRLEFENPGYFLKPGMFVTAQLTSELEPDAILVPDSAVLRSGDKNTVFVALPGGTFDPRDVVIGLEAESDQVEVISGLQGGERVVTSGQFMLDSESQLREAIHKMRSPVETAQTASVPSPATATEPAATNNSPAEKEGVVYVCPMPEHVSIVYDHPGNCPICGMALVPVTPKELKQLQPGGKVLYYTCPMPEHNYVHEDKPGKCPICGMTLIPVMGSPDAAAAPTPMPTQSSPATTTTNAVAKQLYTCPMHPDVISDKPGQCPKCGMNLVPLPNPAN